jgi:hypothetical protein
MRRGVSILGSILSVVLCGVLAACGTTSGSGGSKTGPPPTVTSVAVTPASISVFAGTTQQFTATVVGSAGISTAVTWSVVGSGTITSSGLFTASNNPGPATVMAASQEDSSVTGSAAVTVSVQTVSFGNWYGNLVSSDGTQTLPVDFTLNRTGNNLNDPYRVLVIATVGSSVEPSSSYPPCYDWVLANGVPSISNNQQTEQSWLQPIPNLQGTISGQNISLTYSPATDQTPAEVITLNGTLSQSGSTMSGTFSAINYTCFPVASGTFSFTQVVTDWTTSSTMYSGAIPYGNSTIAISLNGNATLTLGPDAPAGCQAQTFTQFNGEGEGRFFHLWDNNVDQQLEPFVVWGMYFDPTGKTIDGYIQSVTIDANSCYYVNPYEETLLTLQPAN